MICNRSLKAIIWVALAASIGCEQRAEYVEPPPPKVTVATPIERAVQEYFQAPGQTRAAQRVEIRARVGGYLEKILFKDGDRVEEGQLLFVIDKAPYEAALASAEAAVQKAKAQLRLSEQQLQRTRSLVSRQASAPSDLDIDEAERASAAAEVASAEAALRQAKLNLDYAEIHAPFAGRMGRRLIDTGNLVQAETTLLSTLESIDPIHAYFNVSESDLLRFREMQRQGLLKIGDDDALVIELALGDSGVFEFQGTLDYREFGIDPATGTTERRAIFSNEDGRLIPGLFVRIRVAVGDPQDRLLVEERAVSADQRGEYLLVVDEKNVVQYRPVKLGLHEGGLRAIEHGLHPNDRVVVNGLQRARPGSVVNPELVEMGAYLKELEAKEPTAPSGESRNESKDSGEPAPVGEEQ